LFGLIGPASPHFPLDTMAFCEFMFHLWTKSNHQTEFGDENIQNHQVRIFSLFVIWREIRSPQGKWPRCQMAKWPNGQMARSWDRWIIESLDHRIARQMKCLHRSKIKNW
jgi:hypothetical protein